MADAIPMDGVLGVNKTRVAKWGEMQVNCVLSLYLDGIRAAECVLAETNRIFVLA